MTTHTPGPWTIDRTRKHYDADVIRANGIICTVLASNTWGLQRDQDIVRQHHEDEANARLIAAAPRMYAVLRELTMADEKALPDALPTIRAILRDVEG